MERNKISNFLTPDISYLLGLITGRGEIQYSQDVKKIVIDFEYKTLKSIAITKKFDQKLHIQTSLDKIVVRLQNMGINVSKQVGDKKISLVLNWYKEDIAWLFIKFLINGTCFSYHNFQIPEAIFESTPTNKKEFMRGLSDVTGYVRASNYYGFSSAKPKQYRVYIEIAQANWYLPTRICQLLQSLNVSVQNINYGHPNLRDPKNKGGGKSWAKEHQIKVFAENFQEIGFYISHKEEALIELAESNKKHFSNTNVLCNGLVKRKRTKPIHPSENDDKLPDEIKGQHFNNYKEICKCLKCYKQI